MGRDLANNNPPQENRTCLQSAVSSCEASLTCLKTAVGASCSSHITQSQVGQGNLPWSPPGGSSLPSSWQGSLLASRVSNATLKKHPMRDSRVQTLPPLPCSATHALGWVSAEPRACCGVRPGVMSSGLCWQLPSHFNHFPTAETRSVSLQGPSVPAAQLPFSWGHIQVDRVPHLSFI